jgi:predicted anti-sigma-YlaC factor YlaD
VELVMSCEKFKAMTTGYLDGELLSEQRNCLEIHLLGCKNCQKELSDLTRLKEDLAMLKFKEPSAPELQRYWTAICHRLEKA